MSLRSFGPGVPAARTAWCLAACLLCTAWGRSQELKLRLSPGDELAFESWHGLSSQSSMPTVGASVTWRETSSQHFKYLLKVRAARADGSCEIEVRYRDLAIHKQGQDWSSDAAALLQARIVAVVSPGGFVSSIAGFPGLKKRELVLFDKPFKSSRLEPPVEVLTLWTDLEAIFGHGLGGGTAAGRSIAVGVAAPSTAKAGAPWSPRMKRKGNQDPEPSFALVAPFTFRYRSVQDLGDRRIATLDLLFPDNPRQGSSISSLAQYQVEDGMLERLGYDVRRELKDPGSGRASVIDFNRNLTREKSSTRARAAADGSSCPDNLVLAKYTGVPQASRDKLEQAIRATQEFPDLDRWDAQLVEARKALTAMAESSALKSCALPEFHLGRSYRETMLFDASAQWFARALEKDPGLYEAAAALAGIRLLRQDLQSALDLGGKALSACPTHLEALLVKVRALIRLERLEDARALLTEQKKVFPAELWKYFIDRIAIALDGPRWPRVHRVEGDSYEILTSVSEDLARKVLERAEGARQLYTQIFPTVERQARKYRIFVHANETSYREHGGAPQSEGYYDPTFRDLVLCKKPDLRETLVVVGHEAFHQFLHDYMELAPPWFNEGFGDYFGAYDFIKGADGKSRAVPGVSAGRLQDVKAALQADLCPPVSHLMTIPQSQMVDALRGAIYYAQAWSVIYFIIHGDEVRAAVGLERRKPYKDLLKAYFELLRQGNNLHEAYMKTFHAIDMAAFDREWRGFIRSLEGPRAIAPPKR